jgi:imidazolonepropionase-like amidohydrolase
MSKFTCWVVAAVTAAAAWAQPPRPQRATIFVDARLIIGDGTVIEHGAVLVHDGRIAAIGNQDAIKSPAGVARVDLSGKTVMPAMINVHAHLGYEGYTSWGAQNYTPENLLNHVEREAFYGTAAVMSVGTSPAGVSLQFEHDQRAGKFPPAARFLFIPGMAPPNGGPDPVLRVATNALHVIHEVSTAVEARAAVRAMADRHFTAVKIWVDDRRGTYPKMTAVVYEAIIDEAHKHRMMVHAHATTLPDQKAVVRAGADVLVHLVQNERLDEEYLALLKQKKPFWATVIGLGDPTAVCEPDPFFEQALPDKVIAEIRAAKERRALAPYCGPPAPNAATREQILCYNFPRMVAAGARVVLGTDTGVHAGHTFGSGEHVELARWVQLGMSPGDAIIAATARPAELLGLKDLGTLAVGKRADFMVLDANPLDDVHNTRRIASVYVNGQKLDRDAMIARWKKMGE